MERTYTTSWEKLQESLGRYLEVENNCVLKPTPCSSRDIYGVDVKHGILNELICINDDRFLMAIGLSPENVKDIYVELDSEDNWIEIHIVEKGRA